MMDSRPSSKRAEERARHPTVQRLLAKTDLKETVKFRERRLSLALEVRNTEGHRGKIKDTFQMKQDGRGWTGRGCVQILTQETDYYDYKLA